MTIAAAKDTTVLRWSGSIALALALHVLAIGMLLGSGRAEESSVSSPEPILLELTVLPVDAEIVPEEMTDATRDASPPPPTAEEASAPALAEPPPKCDPPASGAGDISAKPVSAPAAPATLTEWKGLLKLHLDRYKQYPADAQRRGQQGTPHVFFTVCRDGRVLAARIVRTSGIESLDRAGIDLVRRADPLPELPQGQPGDSLDVVVPVEFVLAGP